MWDYITAEREMNSIFLLPSLIRIIISREWRDDESHLKSAFIPFATFLQRVPEMNLVLSYSLYSRIISRLNSLTKPPFVHEIFIIKYFWLLGLISSRTTFLVVIIYNLWYPLWFCFVLFFIIIICRKYDITN